MSSRPAKRARSDTDTNAVDPSKLPELVDSIDPKTIASLLITAAKIYPEIASIVQREVDRIAATERTKVLDFDYLSKSAWKTLNVTYDRMKGSHAYEMAGEAAESIEACFETIRTRCPKTASFKTKESALETLRKIAKSICLSDGVVGHEIRQDYDSGGELVPVMLEIAESLTSEELERLRPWCDDKLIELQGIADSYCIFEDLGQVIDLWGGDEEDEDQSSSDSNEEVESRSGDEEEVEDERFVAGMLAQKHFEIL
ncbi:hypothetical protein HO173_006621 [Letharia columbiana]|uniref:Uncharacterized protein n=1 Tax=Letharia columbiana TaxID=112416 RepID=A0A8H6L4L7_9LECA|nr:uncharacterized protein HO173_006621 [Letharia columbiana]KAF6235425.1 hypothetical protein HO173_006621 [Letharia columbiana]